MTKPKFLVDSMLGRLGKWLRILGFDAAFVKESQRRRMLERTFLERRILLTRELKLAQAHAFGLVLVHQEDWPSQLKTVWKALDLKPIQSHKLFQRCTECNVPIKKMTKAELERRRVPPKVREYQTDFFTCPKCRKIFWQGTHVDNSLVSLKKLGIVE